MIRRNLSQKKKGEMMVNQTLELILGAAALFILFIFLYLILAPNFNRPAEAAKSYANTLKEQLGLADRGGVGEFEISKVPSGGEIFVVNFNGAVGSSVEGSGEKYTFFNPIEQKNSIDVCYSIGGVDSGCSPIILQYPVMLVDTLSTGLDGCAGIGGVCSSSCSGGFEDIGGCTILSDGVSGKGKCCLDKSKFFDSEEGWKFGKGTKYSVTLVEGKYVFKKIS